MSSKGYAPCSTRSATAISASPPPKAAPAGSFASLFTDIEGLSHAFDRGFVAYGDAAKHDMLGVARKLIEEKGAVSREVAVAMAEGALERSSADIALSITGYAGPTDEGEQGLVHFGCARRGDETAHREEHFGPLPRGPVRIACLRVALDMLEAALG
ncbi:MAG: CinA family protein [Sphingomonadaceae bacterium]